MPGDVTMTEWECSLAGMARGIFAARHAFLRKQIASVVQLRDAVTVEQKPTFCHIWLPLRRLIQQLQGELEAYIDLEERELLPSLRELDENEYPADDVTETIRFLRHGQAALLSVLSEIGDLTQGFQAPVEACASYLLLLDTLRAIRTDLLMEFCLENDQVFPQTAKALAELNRLRCPNTPHEGRAAAGQGCSKN